MHVLYRHGMVLYTVFIRAGPYYTVASVAAYAYCTPRPARDPNVVWVGAGRCGVNIAPLPRFQLRGPDRATFVIVWLCIRQLPGLYSAAFRIELTRCMYIYCIQMLSALLVRTEKVLFLDSGSRDEKRWSFFFPCLWAWAKT
jgi:hypothetical protein